MTDPRRRRTTMTDMLERKRSAFAQVMVPRHTEPKRQRVIQKLRSNARRGDEGRTTIEYQQCVDSLLVECVLRLIGGRIFDRTVGLVLFQQHASTQYEAVHVCGHETTVGVVRKADDRFSPDIKA